MKARSILGLGLAAALLVGCSKEAPVAAIDRMPVVATVESGVFVAGVPADIAGKPITATDGSNTASVDTVDNKPMDKDLRWYAKQGDKISIGGWAKSITAPLYIELAGAGTRYFARVDTRMNREDVAKFLNVEPTNLGYEFAAPLQNVAPASYRVAVLQIGDTGVERWESPARLIIDEK